MGVFHRNELYNGAWPGLLGEPTCPGRCTGAGSCLPGCNHPSSNRMQCLQISDGPSPERHAPRGGVHHRRQPDTAGDFHSTCHWPGIQWCQVQQGCSYEIGVGGEKTIKRVFQKRYLHFILLFLLSVQQ